MEGDGQSPGNQDSDQASQQQQHGGKKEQTPDAPGQPNQEPQPSKTAEGTPKGNQQDPAPTPAELATAPPADATAQPLMASTGREQWGNLPVHMQELFRAEGGDKVPARYRDWIDSYYRRLNDR